MGDRQREGRAALPWDRAAMPGGRPSLGSLSFPDVPAEVEVTIEVPLFSVVKRKPDMSVDYVSPIPCPFNYGSVPAILAEDGDPLDAVVLGKRLGTGHTGVHRVAAVAKVLDAGQVDDKLICIAGDLASRGPARRLTPAEGALIGSFFRVYAVGKSLLNSIRRKKGETRFDGILPYEPSQGRE